MEVEPRLMSQSWMVATLETILAGFSAEELDGHARSHCGEVLSVLGEAVAHHDSHPDIPIIQVSSSQNSYIDVGSEQVAERISALRQSQQSSQNYDTRNVIQTIRFGH